MRLIIIILLMMDDGYVTKNGGIYICVCVWVAQKLVNSLPATLTTAVYGAKVWKYSTSHSPILVVRWYRLSKLIKKGTLFSTVYISYCL